MEGSAAFLGLQRSPYPCVMHVQGNVINDALTGVTAPLAALSTRNVWSFGGHQGRGGVTVLRLSTESEQAGAGLCRSPTFPSPFPCRCVEMALTPLIFPQNISHEFWTNAF